MMKVEMKTSKRENRTAMTNRKRPSRKKGPMAAMVLKKKKSKSKHWIISRRCSRMLYTIWMKILTFLTFVGCVMCMTMFGTSPLRFSHFSFASLMPSTPDMGVADYEHYLIDTEGCRIRKYTPFDPSVSALSHEEASYPGACHEEGFLKSEEGKVFLNVDMVKKKFQTEKLNCTYNSVIRDPHDSGVWADFDVSLGDSKPLEFGVALEDNFIRVECSNGKRTAFVDYLTFMLLKSDVEERCKMAEKELLGQDTLNIIMISVDSTSTLDFKIRFPITNGYLRTSLKAFEFYGYTKVADNTYPNIVALFTGHLPSHYHLNDKPVDSAYYGNLDLVWKEFSSLGYRTLLIEDNPNWGTFNQLKKGFKITPTDYYLRPYNVILERTKEKWRTKNGSSCFGRTSEVEFFYGYFRKFIKKMDKRPFFATVFVSRVTHDESNTVSFADKPTLKLLQDLKKSNMLNKSALFFFSDHGLRYGPIRNNSYMGKGEERMPFMFQSYPDWFLKKHEDFELALRINQRRLTTPFDVHKTLQHLVSLSSKNKPIGFGKKNFEYAQSLFREISRKRSCVQAHVSAHWCACDTYVKLKVNNSNVITVAYKTLATINHFINGGDDKGRCAVLSLKRIVSAYLSVPDAQTRFRENVLDYTVTVKVSPSEALFESTFRMKKGKLRLIGEISRTDDFGNQSWCVGNRVLRKYCFCNNLTS